MFGMKKVLVISTINGIAGRNGITGIFNYVNEGHDWSIQFLQNPGKVDDALLQATLLGGVDGIIVSPRSITPQIARFITRPVPVVMVHNPLGSIPRHGPKFALLKNDDLAVGRLAAEYLLSKARFRSYAFIPTPSRTNWSEERFSGFAETLGGKGMSPVVWQRAAQTLEDFLKSLQKPAAVLGATDLEAIDVISACRRLRIDIPSRVAVLGVDDDEMRCETTKPTLSSVKTDDVMLGSRAAKELAALMSSKSRRAFLRPILVPPSGVTERNSTRSVPPAGYLIQEALSFVKLHLTEGIGVDDVVKHLGVSHSLVRARFRTVYGASLRDVILDMRLKAAMSLLGKTNASVHAIAKKTGFSSDAHFIHFFKKRTRTTPSAWRKSMSARRAKGAAHSV